jgi:hypothetical protein
VSTDDAFLSVLDDLTALLRACGELDQANWVEERKARAETANNGADVEEVKHEVRGVLAGMGSLSDLYLDPNPESGLGKDEARRRQFELVDRLDELTAN